MKRIICMVLVFALIAAPSALAEGHRELENYTRYFDYQPEVNEPLGMIPGTDHSTLVLYFSRVGNTAFPEDVDAVSYATLNLDSEGKLIGTAQMAACWIAEATAKQPAGMFSPFRRLTPIPNLLRTPSLWS